MADENFLVNPFYIALTKQFADLYAKACARKCIICIPTAASLRMIMNRGRPRVLIPKAELGLHILMPSPLQSLEEGLYDCVQSGYSVKIDKPANGKNGVIRAYSGFGRNFTAEILSEEKCYDEKSGGSFTLLVIDHPLGEGMDIYNGAAATLDYSFDNLSSASCEIFLRDSLGALDSGPILASFKKSIEQLYRTYVILAGYLDDLAKKIQAVVTKAVDESLRATPSLNRKDTTAAFEVFGHNILYHKIFTHLCEKEYPDREALISRNLDAVRRPSNIDSLNIESATFPIAAATLVTLPTQTSPLQQLVCVAKALQAMQEDLITFQKEQVRLRRAKPSSITLAADDTLNILLFLLSSKRIPYLKSSIAYMTKFCWTIPDASLQYALTTFEAAVRYLESSSSSSDDEARSRDSSVNEDRPRTGSVDDHSGSSVSDRDWDIIHTAKSVAKSFDKPGGSRPASVSPAKSSAAAADSKLDGKLRNLNLLMDESASMRRPIPQGNQFVDPPKTGRTAAPSNSDTPRAATAKPVSPLDFLMGGQSFGQQK